MLKKGEWYKCIFSFQLEKDFDFGYDELIEIIQKLGKVIGSEGKVADIQVEPFLKEVKDGNRISRKPL